MRLLVLLAAGLFAGSLFAADDKKDEKKVKDEEAIVGVWQVEKWDEGGANERKEEEVRKARMEFNKDGKASLTFSPDRTISFDYALDPSAKPKAIDWSKGKQDTIPGIYTLDGDTLTVCILHGSSDNLKRDRPTEFKVDAKKEIRVITFKRVKVEKKDEKKGK